VAEVSVSDDGPSMPFDQSPAAGLLDAAVPMNISLIAGVAVAVAVLLCMLVYVVVKWSAPPLSGSSGRGGRHATQSAGINGSADEKSALRDFEPCHERSPPMYSAPGTTPPATMAAILENGKPHSPVPVAIFLGSGDGGKKRDVKEWFV
jgi:hypothetical protein